jgi:hypothetical protein
MRRGAGGDPVVGGEERKTDIESRVLHSRLVNLTLDWELAALTMDVQRYKTNTQMERESLRDSANTYRKCVAELNEILAGGFQPAGKTNV